MDGDSLANCSCNTCSGQIEFDASLLQSGSMVVCPHCGIETALYIQKNNLAPVRLASRKTTQPQISSEGQLQTIASLVIIGGTDCPSCNASQTQRLEMAFRAGISNKRGTVVGFDLQGDVGLGSYGGTSQTGLSMSARPPARKPIGTVYFCAFVIGILIFAGLSWLVNFFLGIVAVIGFIVLIYFLTAKDIKYNSEIQPQLLKRWQAAWICLRCGKKWIPEK